MTAATGTGARWLDVVLIGGCALVLPLMVGVVIVTHLGTGIDTTLSPAFLVFAVIGVGLVGIGLFLGRRTRWSVPDPGRKG